MAYIPYDIRKQYEKDWLTVKQVAIRARCSESTVKRRIAAGVLPAKTFGEGGRKLYINPTDVDRVFVSVKPREAEAIAVSNGCQRQP